MTTRIPLKEEKKIFISKIEKIRFDKMADLISAAEMEVRLKEALDTLDKARKELFSKKPTT